MRINIYQQNYLDNYCPDPDNNILGLSTNLSCILNIPELDSIRLKAFKEIEKLQLSYIKQAIKKEALFGRIDEANQLYNKANDLLYLIEYFTLMWLEKERLGDCFSNDILEKYDYNCIKKSYACKGIDTDLFISIFQLVVPKGGINEMTIFGTCNPLTVY